jgi:ABC-2 type transport system permease protein
MSDHALEAVRAGEAGRQERRTWAGTAWRQFRLERRMFWRNPTAAFFGFLLPLLLLAMFGAVFSGEQDQLDVVVPGIAGLSVMAATFVALAYNLTFLRERGILKRLRGTPLTSSAYLAGIAANAIANTVLQVAVVIVAGRVFFGIPWPGDWLALLVFLAAGVVCFASLGVALSHAIPNSESAPAYVNAVFLPMIMLAGVFYDDEDAPAVLRDLAEVLPLKHLIDGLSGAMVHGEGIADHMVALGALCVWAAVGVALAVRGFSWDARRD